MTTRTRVHRSPSLTARCASVALACSASMPAAKVQAADADLLDVVVTARKVEERVGEVPVAISAFTAEELAKRNVTGLYDVAQHTAGFSFENYSGATTPAPVIRGLSQNALTDRVQNVGTFVDGVHVQNPGNVDFSLMDIERLEIVKGPQSAEYGRSTFAGAINWVPTKPALGDWRAFLTGTLGTDERWDVRGAVSIPLWDDRLAVRVSGMNTSFDGTFRNNYPGSTRPVRSTIHGYTFGGTDGNLGGYDNEARQAALRFRPVDALTVDLTYYRSVTKNEAGAFLSILPRSALVVPGLPAYHPLTCSPRLTTPAGFTGAFNQLYCGKLDTNESQVMADPRQTGAVTHTDLTIGRVEYRITDALAITYVYGRGLYDAANFAAPRPEAYLVNGDATLPKQPGTGQAGLQFSSNPFSDQESRSHEIRVDGRTGRVDWRLGYYHSDLHELGVSGLIEYRLPLSKDPTGQVTYGTFPFASTLSTFHDVNDAVFGSVRIPFANEWTVEVEARQSKDDRSQLPLNRNRTFKEFTPRVNLKWMPHAGWLFYGSVAKGTKSGGFNGVTADEPVYDPEKNITYEIGGKQTLAEATLQINYAVFFIDWTDLQLSVPDFFPTPPSQQDPNYIGNVKGATSKGVEFEAVWAPVDRWRFNLAASYVMAQFKDGTVDTTFGRLCESRVPVCTFLPRSPQLPQGGSPIGGNDLPRTPRGKASLGAEYRRPAFADWELSFRGDLAFQTKSYVENLNLAYLPSRTVLNANISLDDVAGHWHASLWAKNLTDEVYASSAFAVVTSNSYSPTLGPGRTAGVSVRYNFE